MHSRIDISLPQTEGIGDVQIERNIYGTAATSIMHGHDLIQKDDSEVDLKGIMVYSNTHTQFLQCYIEGQIGQHKHQCVNGLETYFIFSNLFSKHN